MSAVSVFVSADSFTEFKRVALAAIKELESADFARGNVFDEKHAFSMKMIFSDLERDRMRALNLARAWIQDGVCDAGAYAGNAHVRFTSDLSGS